ncbi:hypothetical protein [Deinococcus pimensis]|uniref:hypothetical protein n=1 Tax=Deinococcus pimensis TaxID=309888 RepID=UPI0004810BD4|nr:hypothetical protein [Deinococcus pimensis]
MRKLTTAAAAVVLTTSIIATAQTLNPLTSTTVWLRTNSGPAQLVDMYVDGQLAARSMFPYSITFQGLPMAMGNHVFTVVPAGHALGTADLMSKTLNVASANRTYVMIFSDGKFNEDRFKMDLKTYNPDQ